MSSKVRASPEKLVKQEFETMNSGELERLDDIYATDAVVYDSYGQAYDRDAWKEYLMSVRMAFPDFHVDTVEMGSDDDVVFIRYTMGGTMEGEYRGFEPTGKSFEIHSIHTSRVEDGKIVETWIALNAMAMSQQLGLLG